MKKSKSVTMKKQVAALEERNRDLTREVEKLKEPLAFEYNDKNPTLIIKLGDKGKGWFPGSSHYTVIQKQLKGAGVDKKYNIILFHWAIETELVK